MNNDPRSREVAELAAALEREHPIRLQMLAIVTLSAIAGFLVSFTLLHMGVTTMAVRYAIATLCGYGVFVACVRIWLLGRDHRDRLDVIGIAVVGRVVWQSPNLIAEMLVDGAVAGSALRGVLRTHHRRELDVVSHTWIPALIVLTVMIAIGVAGQHVQPDAVSIGDLFR